MSILVRPDLDAVGIVLESGEAPIELLEPEEIVADRACRLAESLAGDARELVQALRDGGVRGFRGKSIETLSSYLEENGYLDDQPILEPSQIREMIAPLVFIDRNAGLISSQRVDRLASLVLADSPGLATI